VSVGLNWDSESPDADHIAEVLQCIGTTLTLPYVSISVLLYRTLVGIPVVKTLWLQEI
jgi:hypothetical protein